MILQVWRKVMERMLLTGVAAARGCMEIDDDVRDKV